MEEYTGVKFKVIFKEGEKHAPAISDFAISEFSNSEIKKVSKIAPSSRSKKHFGSRGSQSGFLRAFARTIWGTTARRGAREGNQPFPSHYGSSGNISVRDGDSFFITATGCKLGELTADDFVEVLNVSANEVTVAGDKEPSSETMLHAMIYQERPDINCIIHIHDYPENPNLPITENEQPYGTPALVQELKKIINQGDYLVLKNHGIIALGKTIKETQELCRSKHSNGKMAQST